MQRADSAGGGVTASLAVVAALAAPGPGASAQPRPLARELAAVSDIQPESATWETHIAAGEDKVISVFHVAEGSLGDPQHIGYAIATRDPNADPNSQWSWDEEGIIDPNADPNEFEALFDPSIAYDRVSGDFMVCALNYPDTSHSYTQIVVSRYDADACAFGPWECIAGSDPNDPVSGFDKPWIVAGGAMTPPACGGIGGFGPASLTQEFYIAWYTFPGGNLQYRRSIYHGNTGTWVGGNALTDLDDPNSAIPIAAWPVPRVHNKRPLYVAALSDSAIKLWRGDDVNCGDHAGEVEFTPLLDADDPNSAPIEIPYLKGRGPNTVVNLPNGFVMGRGHFSVGKGVDVAVDPSDADRMYVVLHDTAAADPNDTDMNIYMHVLTRESPYTWSVSARIEVNNDDTPFEADQFMPMIDVGNDGDIHVIFYDDRDYNLESDQEDGSASPNAKYDVYYAWSPDQGENWTNQELFAEPNEPVLDYVDLSEANGFVVRDYIGIDVGADRVWTSFMGNADADLSADPNHPRDPSVIWSSQILPE